MAKENKVEYERVDSRDDQYKRILVKFNPKFLRGSDFEIVFIPLGVSYDVGKVFVTEIDSMSTIHLYRWAMRQECLSQGLGKFKRGTIIPKKVNRKTADIMRTSWHKGTARLEPRQIISRVKRVFELIGKQFSESTSYVYNHFLFCGELGSLPFANVDFNMEKLRVAIEESPYRSQSSGGEVVERPLVEHLFDTHKTEYVEGAILNFLEIMRVVTKRIVEEYDKKRQG